MYVQLEQAKLARGEASDLLAFQDVNVSAGQNFMLCVATQWQLEFAAARGHTAILVDATHSTNQLKVCTPFKLRKCHIFWSRTCCKVPKVLGQS